MFGQWMGNDRIKLEEDKKDKFDDLIFLSKQTLISMLRKDEKEINSLMQNRKKWKYRYYRMKKKNRDLQKSVVQIYDDYQDIGKMAFDYSDKLEQKDKIIDLMANSIATNDSNLCQYLDITTKCKYYAGENGKICDECIKQYFERQAKNDTKCT